MAKGIGIRLELGVAVVTEYDAEFVQCQPDGAGKKPRLDTFEAHHPAGFSARPQDPEQDEFGTLARGCTIVLGVAGSDKFVLFLNDPRAAGLVPVLEKGSSVQYAHRLSGKKSYDHHDGTTGTKRILVEYPGGAHEIIISGEDGTLTINGATITPDGNVITADGINLRTHTHSSAIGPTGPPVPTPGP